MSEGEVGINTRVIEIIPAALAETVRAPPR
jgi:hypothetical protein